MAIETLAAMTIGAQAVSGITSLIGAKTQADGAIATGAMKAHAARYEGAVAANRALVEAENQARMAEARAEADLFNSKVSDQMAGSETERAGAEANDFRKAQSARIASSRAQRAASGLALEGSPLMVDEAVFTEVEYGAQRLVHAGQVTATRLNNQGRLLRRSSGFDRETARTVRLAARDTARYSQEAGELVARGAKVGADFGAAGARIAGIGDAARSFSSMGSSLMGKPGETLLNSGNPWNSPTKRT
jgi:hypothetical protein